MEELAAGLYELLVTEAIAERLEDLKRKVAPLGRPGSIPSKRRRY
ncbi:MAG: hypothetical protein QOJ29_717 [Thermoleophilaceae bacterium]|jgi:hypothetical protein|nr:hypothetical protein [Thermoleophilaceae bacterium]